MTSKTPPTSIAPDAVAADFAPGGNLSVRVKPSLIRAAFDLSKTADGYERVSNLIDMLEQIEKLDLACRRCSLQMRVAVGQNDRANQLRWSLAMHEITARKDYLLSQIERIYPPREIMELALRQVDDAEKTNGHVEHREDEFL